jgi:thiol-disulfide isomerase/thioredoxin
MKKLIIPALLALVVVACGADGSGSSAASVGATGSGDENLAFGEVTVTGNLPAYAAGPDDPAAGAEAPELSGVDPTGAAVDFTPGTNPTMLVFLAHWCSHCQAEVPRIVEWLEANPDTSVDVIAVTSGTDETAPNFPPSDWLAGENWPAKIILDDADSTAGQAFGLTSFPFWVGIGADGTVVQRIGGELPAEAIDEAMKAVAAG